MARRGRKAELRQTKTYLNPESEVEAAIIEFIGGSVRMRNSLTIRAMLAIAWEQMQHFGRDDFDRHFYASHNFTSFERIRSKHDASTGTDSLLSNPPTPKLK